MRFLLRWQHVAPGAQVAEGTRGLLAVIEQLQGFEVGGRGLGARALAARVREYRGEWLDALCLSGDVVWGRLSLAQRRKTGCAAAAVARDADHAALRGGDLPWLLAAARARRESPRSRRDERASARLPARPRRAVRRRSSPPKSRLEPGQVRTPVGRRRAGIDQPPTASSRCARCSGRRRAGARGRTRAGALCAQGAGAKLRR